MPLYGIASAVHGGETLRWTTSTVVARSAGEIVLDDVWREEVDPGNAEAVRATIARCVDSVRRAVAARRGNDTVAVVYCTQEGPRIPDMEAALGASPISKLVESAVREGLPDPSSISFHPRGYKPRAFVCDVPVRRREGPTIEERARARRNAHLRDLYLKAEHDPGGEAMHRLGTYVDVLAERYAQRYRESGWDASTRFFLLGSHVPERKDDVQYNLIRWFDFRKRFAEALIGHLGIDHCICVKAPLDPPSPPTADIAATYLADRMVEHPTLAMVLLDAATYDGEQLKCT